MIRISVGLSNFYKRSSSREVFIAAFSEVLIKYVKYDKVEAMFGDNGDGGDSTDPVRLYIEIDAREHLTR